MNKYVHTEWFDWWDKAGNYDQVIADFDVEEVGEWIDGMWCIHHDVDFVDANVYDNDLDKEELLTKEQAILKFGKKQVEDWVEYVCNKLDEECVYE
jgi:hypothetical protein